jgi:hypothetical protein
MNNCISLRRTNEAAALFLNVRSIQFSATIIE